MKDISINSDELNMDILGVYFNATKALDTITQYGLWSKIEKITIS